MKKLFFLFAALTVCVIAGAQTPDTVKVVPSKILNAPFPATRDFELQYEQLGSRNFHSRLFDQDFQQGKIKSERRFLFAANIPIIKQRKYTLSGSFRYVNDAFDLTGLNPAGPGTPAYGTDDHPVFHFFSVAASFTYFSKLFGKPLVLNTSVTTDGNDEALQRVTGMASAVLVLKITPQTTIMTGLVGLLDNTAVFPLLPAFSLQHGFGASPWKLDLFLPQRLLVKRLVFKSAQISFGTGFGGNVIYVNPANPTLPGIYQYRQLALKTGAIFDQKLTDRFILSIGEASKISLTRS